MKTISAPSALTDIQTTLESLIGPAFLPAVVVLLAKRAAIALTWKARAEKLKAAALIARAREAAQESLSDLRQRLRDMPRQPGFYPSHGASHAAETLKVFRKARALCNKRGFVRLADDLKARMAVVKEEAEAWESRFDAAQAFGQVRKTIAAIRRAEELADLIEGEGTAGIEAAGNASEGLARAMSDINGGLIALKGMASDSAIRRVSKAARIAGLTDSVLAARAARLHGLRGVLDKARDRAETRENVQVLRLWRDAGDNVTEEQARDALSVFPRRFTVPPAFKKAGWKESDMDSLRLRISDSMTAARERDAARTLAEWREGKGSARVAGHYGPALLRVKGDVLQTSQGAEVPLSHALRVFAFLRHVRATGQAWQANGRTLPVGLFRVDRVEANGDFRAGCHSIQWAEVESVAAAIGVADTAPADTTVHREAAHA